MQIEERIRLEAQRERAAYLARAAQPVGAALGNAETPVAGSNALPVAEI